MAFCSFRRGAIWTTDWMRANCRTTFVTVKDDEGGGLNAALSEFTRYLADNAPPGGSVRSGWNVVEFAS